jgi:phage RecT family recombinase
MNELVIGNITIDIPNPQHDGFAALAPLVKKLEQYFPPLSSGAQLMAAILSEANKKTLAGCTRDSVVKSAFNAAVLGLPPGDFLGMIHFVPFKDRRRNIEICTVVVGYKGWLELAYSADFLSDCHTDVALIGEEFDRWTDEAGPHFRHTPDNEHEDRCTWENVIAAYCVWHGRAGGKGFAVVGKSELSKLRGRGNVWESNPIAMAKKTAIHRAAKTWKRTKGIAHASALDDAIEAEIPQPAFVSFEGPQEANPGLDSFQEAREPA